MNAFNAAMGQFELFDYIPLGVCILRRDFSVLFWNRYLEEWTGLKRGDILGHSILDQFPNLKSPVFHRRLQDVFDGGPPLVYSAQLHRYFIPCPLDSGQYRSQQTTVTPVPAPAEGDFYALVVIEDVTDMVQRLQDYRQMRDRAIEEIAERKWVEAELRQRNRELALLNRVITISAANPDVREILQTACREMVYSFGMTIATATMLNPDRTAVTNTAAYAVSLPDGALPFDPDSIIGVVIPVADIPLALEQLEQATSTPVVIHNPAESSVLGPARQYFEEFNVATMVILPLLVKGRLTGSLNLFSLAHRSLSERELATMQNVADQISGTIALAELNRLSRRLSAALEQSTECVLITDPQGRIEYVNPAFEHTTGFTADEAAGQMLDILQSQPPETAESQAQNPPADYTTALQTGQTWQGRLVSRKKDGTSFTEDVTLSPVRDEEGNIVSFVRVSRDITRELELEAQYFGAQKLASLGQLAGGIAHDFNNLLTAINGFAEILQLRLPPDDPNRQAVHHIYHAGQRAADLVNQLLAFSRKQIIQPKITSLNQVVQNITPMLQRLIGEDIILQTHLADDLWPVKIDPTQFEQVIMNLATNARDAMPHGGILLIETRNAVLDQAYADAHVGVDPGDYVMLAVSDTGTGMSEEVKARIFDPFFSTKEVGKGTGLGLATVYGVVKQNRGHIWVYSEPGQGTTFKLYVPRAEQPEAAAEEPAEFTPVQMPGGHETILLVEDNPEVRELVEHILRSQGYNLLQAEDGLNALLLARDYTGPIDLVITDVVMPNMSGPVMVSQLKQLKPGLKVLYMSGYTGNVLARHNVLEADTQFIGKPFSPVELTQKIRQVLDSNGS